MVRIYYILPITGLDEEKKQNRQRVLESLAARDTTIKLVSTEKGPKAIESKEDEEQVEPILRDFVKENVDRFDGAIIGCFADPGIRELRKMTNKPIVGPGRSALAFASGTFDTFSIITTSGEELSPIMRAFTGAMGLEDQLESIISVDVSVLDISYNPTMALNALKEKTKDLTSPAIVPGCMGFAFLFAERNLRRIGGSIIVNPLNAAIRSTEALTR